MNFSAAVPHRPISIVVEATEFQQSNVTAGYPAVLSDNLTLTTDILIITRPHISPHKRNINNIGFTSDISLHEACFWW